MFATTFLRINCITLKKAAATAKSPVSAAKLYHEKYSCKHVNLSLYIYNRNVRSYVCLSVTFGFGGGGGGVDKKEGAIGRGRWISMMECQSGHTFPEQRQVTQLVVTYILIYSFHGYNY